MFSKSEVSFLMMLLDFAGKTAASSSQDIQHLVQDQANNITNKLSAMAGSQVDGDDDNDAVVEALGRTLDNLIPASFTLVDEVDSRSRATGRIMLENDHYLCIGVDGYSDISSDDNEGVPLVIEKYDGELKVRIYGDINRDDPTHSISLEGARNTCRTRSI